MELEGQHMTYDFSVYSDVNDKKWVKCDDWMSPFHLKCAMSEPEHVVAKQEICLYFFQFQKRISLISVFMYSIIYILLNFFI